MQLTHNFTVPTDVDQAWDVLLDIERVAPCMPGAAIDTVDGDDFTGTVKVRLGPIGLTYKGKASFLEKDAVAHRVVIDAQGKDARGNGTAKARVTATLTAQGDGTAVTVVTDLTITGKPAQFGRGVMVDVGNKLIGQFADCLAGKLTGEEAGGLVGAAPGGVAGAEAAAGVAGAEAAGGLAGAEAAGGLAGAEAAAVPGAETVEASAGLGSPHPSAEEWLANADLEGAEQLGTAEPGSAEPSSAEAGAAGLAELGAAPTVSPSSTVAGPGLADAGTSAAGMATPDQSVEPAAAAEAAPPTPPAAQRPAAPRPTVAEVEPIDLLGSAGPAVAKRLAPVAVVALLVVLLLRRRRRAAARSAALQARADYRAAVKRWAEAERRAAIERRNLSRTARDLSRTARAGLPRPSAGSHAWPAFRTADQPGGHARQQSE